MQRILLIDNQGPARATLHEHCLYCGYRVDASADALDIERLLDTHRYQVLVVTLARAASVDPVVLQAARRFRMAARRGLIFLVTSGSHGAAAALREALDNVIVLNPPLPPQELIDTIRYLQRPAVRRGRRHPPPIESGPRP